jgi:hypothetical protein
MDDEAVSGADPIAERPGFKDMFDRIASNGVRCILGDQPRVRDFATRSMDFALNPSND